MINLIKNELIKIFKKKNILILLIIIFAFTLLSNIMYNGINIDAEELFEKQYIKQIKEEIKSLDLNNKSQIQDYIDLKSDIDLYELKQKYKKDSWQRTVIEKDMEQIIRELNASKTSLSSNEEAAICQNRYDEILNYLNNKTWKDYAKYQLEKERLILQENNKYLIEAEEKSKKDLYKQIIDETENKIYRLNVRLEKNIIYGNDYLNIALESYNKSFNISLNDYIELQKETLKGNYNEQEVKKEYMRIVTENEQNKYMIENKVDLNNEKTLRYGLMNTLSNNTIFILVITVMISGSIVASEFDKGTIKLLLIRPFNRTKILLSKFITCIIILIFAICSAYVMEIIVGGLFFGFKNLNVPIIMYNLSTNQVIHIGLFKYIIDMILTTLPQYILLLTLSFALSTILTNSALAIALPLVGSFVSELINGLIQVFKLDFLKYFVTLHWDLSQYLYGAPVQYKGFNIWLSILICMIYFIIMIIPTFIIFKKKNIKNI